MPTAGRARAASAAAGAGASRWKCRTGRDTLGPEAARAGRGFGATPRRWLLMGRTAQLVIVLVAFWVIVAVACKVTSESPPDGGGAHGAGGCPTGPVPLYTLHLTAADGQVPPDLTLSVDWSAGNEPTFDLADPSTWKSVDDGSNVDCNVPAEATPPVSLDELRCELWTSGPTDVAVEAAGYLTVEKTLTPPEVDECDVPVPSVTEVELVRDPDAGT